MFVLIWVTLLFANTGLMMSDCGQNKPTITPSERSVTAEAGLCVVLPCSFTDGNNLQVNSIIWFKSNNTWNGTIFNSSKDAIIQSEFKERVSLLETDLKKKNCSIIIKNLTKSDSGSYRLTVAVNETSSNVCTSLSEANITLTVTDLSQKPTVLIPPMTESQLTTLTCTAPGVCSGSTPNITWTWRGANQHDTEIRGNITNFKTENVTLCNHVKWVSTLTFTASAEHHSTQVTCTVDCENRTNTTNTLNVTYFKEVNISGTIALKKGDTLNLTCSADSFPASFISWAKSDSTKSLEQETENKTTKGHRSASLIISNVTEEHFGLYNCTATHLNKTITKTINVKLLDVPRILSVSECVLQSEVLTCVCISEGFPLPTIEWPQLKNHTKYCVTTTASNDTVNSTITLSVKHSHNATVECVSNNSIGRANETLNIAGKGEDKKENGSSTAINLLELVKKPEVMIATLIGFLSGIILSTIIVCFVTKCCRKKRRRSKDLSENLEMVTAEAIPVLDADQAAEYDGIHEPQAAGGETESALQLTPDGDVAPKEVEYSNIDFSALKGRDPAEVQDTTDTDYAEIKKEGKREENGEEDGEMLECNGEEKVVTGEDNETKQAEEEGGEDVALYSTVDEIMS